MPQNFRLAISDYGRKTGPMPLRILIAPDKFKGTLTAREAADAIAKGWQKARPDDKLDLLPISDGGDGFGTTMSELLGAHQQTITTVDAAHRSCRATWWWDPQTRTSVVESALVVGLAMLPGGLFHPYQLDTFGLGKVVKAAARRDAQQILIGIGGSATNDGGFGLARALGWTFWDDQARPIKLWTDLEQLTEIRAPRTLNFPRIQVAVDVQNRLLGKLGASRVYGPQKGLRDEDFDQAERCLRRLAAVIKKTTRLDVASRPGAGAAGGLGFGLAVFARARLVPGFQLFADGAGLWRRLRAADLVITGEGAIDDSTVMGKGVGEVALACRKHKIPCVGLAGRATRTPKVKKLFQVVEGLTDFLPSAVAMRQPQNNLARLAERVAAKWRQ